MAQKGRDDMMSTINSNVYDNNNKEILALMVRNVLKDLKDSYFNLIDDRLASLKYDENNTLAQVLANSANIPPLWGSSDYFDVGSADGNIQTYSDKGIVQTMGYNRQDSSNCEVTLYIPKGIGNRKVLVNVFHDDIFYANNNDICAPVIRVTGGEVKIALREVTKKSQKIRVEIMAFQVNKVN